MLGTAARDPTYGLVSAAVIDAHYTQRGRMGRLLGVLGRAIHDSGNHNIVAIGLDQKTGVAIRNDIATVIGVGEVAFFRESSATVLLRDAGRPLYYTDLVLDRLTSGWSFDMVARTPVTSPLPA